MVRRVLSCLIISRLFFFELIFQCVSLFIRYSDDCLVSHINMLCLQIVKITLDDHEMDNFVLCVANRKSCAKLAKDMNDLVNIIYIFF